MARIEVVIPYYQREAGHLVRAVNSIMAQGFDDIRVNIVDDGSPRPANLDLDTLPPSVRAKVNLVLQTNTGANGARNRGLSEIGPDAEFVALLDSDDEWLPGHLEHAIEALSCPGAGFFYDTIFIDQKFAEGYTEPSNVLDAATLGDVEGQPHVKKILYPLRVLCGEWYRHMHLSVTVMTGDLARRVRFDAAFTIADDFEFFYQCARYPGGWYIDTRNGAARGTGANIWHGVKTTDLRYSQEKFFSMVVLTRLLREPSLDEETRRTARARIRAFREQFYWSQRNRLKARMRLNLDLWLRFIRHDPALLGFALRRILHLPAAPKTA